MTDQKHIIELAKSVGILFQTVQGITGKKRTMTHGSQALSVIEAFYHASRNEGLEAAKQACIPLEHYGEVSGILCVKAIEKLKEQK